MRFTSAFRTSFVSCLVLMMLSSLIGCQQRVAGKLSGRWEGRPDSAATREAREADKYGDIAVGAADSSSAARPTEPPQITDWEEYDVAVVMDFVDGERVEMSLGDEQPRSGAWKVISTSPTGCTIEVLSEQDGQGGAGEGSGEASFADRRRFELVLDERDGVCVGFQLTESGADPQLGTLYFQRPKSSSVAEPE